MFATLCCCGDAISDLSKEFPKVNYLSLVVYVLLAKIL